jgi:hypothetical protein
LVESGLIQGDIFAAPIISKYQGKCIQYVLENQELPFLHSKAQLSPLLNNHFIGFNPWV